MGDKVFGRITADEWSALRHAVADRDRELDIFHASLYVRTDGCTAADEVAQFAPKRLGECLANLAADHRTGERYTPEELDHLAREQRVDVLLVDLLDHQRHSDDYIRLNVLQCFEQDRWGRALGEEIDMCSAAERVEKFTNLPEHVCQRQHRYESLPRIDGQH